MPGSRTRPRSPFRGWNRMPSSTGSSMSPPGSTASVLTGFSQYEPVDQRPATDTTQVLVWYSPTGIYFGIKGVRGRRTRQRHARGPGPDRRRRLRPAPARHVRRSAPGVSVRRQPVRNPAGRQPDRGRAGQGEPGRRGERDQPHAGLCLRLPGTAHGLWLRGRDPHPLPEHQLSGCRCAELGHQRHPQGAALGVHRHLDAHEAGRGVVSGPVRPAGGSAGAEPGHGGRHDAHVDGGAGRRSGRKQGVELRL